jgi:tetratricopeptide (TPR) repeat protein
MRLYKNELVNDTVEIGKALLLCGRLNDVTGDYEKMMSNFNEALRVFKAAAGETDMNVSIALSNIGVAYSRVQKYSEAIEKSKEALRIRKMHTSNDRDVADSLFNIGNLYYEWGESQEAVPYLKGSLNLYRALLGDDDIAIANCQVKLGTIYYNSGEVDEAVNSFSEALYVCEEAEEDAEQLLIPVYKGLGNCYFSKRDLELALESFASCLKIQKLEFGDDCAEIGDTCDSIGLVYLESGKQAEAIQLYKKALQIHERHHGKTSPQCLASQINISKALMAEDRCDDAVEKLHECIELYSTQGKESEQIAMIYQQIGIALSKSSQHDDAIVAFNKALDLRIKIFGKESTQVAEAMLDLGSALEEHDSDEVC